VRGVAIIDIHVFGAWGTVNRAQVITALLRGRTTTFWLLAQLVKLSRLSDVPSEKHLFAFILSNDYICDISWDMTFLDHYVRAAAGRQTSRMYFPL
jgi:hypothetical protein